jgi:hypothetical protein
LVKRLVNVLSAELLGALAGITSPSPASALAWCKSQVFDRDHCVVAFGTDTFCAMVQRLALALIDDPGGLCLAASRATSPGLMASST